MSAIAQPAAEPVDPIVLELVNEHLMAIVREMRTIVIRTAYSGMIHEGHDFSCGVLDPAGNLVTASEVDQPTHLSALPWSARTVLGKYASDLAAGDLFLHNDPYTGGTHLNDVALIHPCFVDGRPLALLAVMAHWQDVGGMVPGSLSGSASEIYQEGVRIPAVRVGRGGELQREVLDLLLANMRAPDDRLGDLRAMWGACRVAEGKLRRLVDRWGAATLEAVLGALLARAEHRMREAIRRLPRGRYAYETYLDHSGADPEPLLLQIGLTVADDDLHADFTGAPPQVAGPTNLGPAHAATAVYTMVKAFLDPGGPINSGAMRPLRVSAPEGTILNARPPAACGAIGEVRRAVEGLVMGALGRIVPERLIGDLKGASNITSVSGRDAARAGRAFTFVEFPAGGTGAWADADGNNSVRNFAEGDLSSIHPAEAVEASYPLRVVRSALRVDSGGDGRRRGGLGLEREVLVLAPDAVLSVLSDKNVIPPYGVHGGMSGAPNRFTVRRDGREIEPSPLPGKITRFPLRAGDVVLMRTAGGGGWGDPLEREPERVLADLCFGYVSEVTARDTYGLAGRGQEVEAEPTSERRERLRSGRPRLRALTLRGAEHAGNRRIAALSPAAAASLSLAEGDLVEFPVENAPSLRAWVRLDPALADDACALGAEGLAMLGLPSGGTLTLRRLGTRHAG